MNVMDIDCPWCAGAATVDAGPMATSTPTLVCRECSITVELAPDPINVVALAV